MIQIDLPPLVKRLNLFSRQALEMAASECMSQQAAEITVSHVLIQMLAMPRSDLRVITRQGDIGMEELRQALTVENYTTARSADSYPAFSPMLVEWLKEGWLLASAEMQHSELRGGVLLLALLHSPLRYIPPAAARLLTEQYISDYTATWRAGMDNLNIRNFESIGQLTGALEQVISGDQPLQRALTVLRDNTQPGVFSEKLSAKEREEALAEPDYQLLTRLGHEFAPENSTLAVQKDKESTMQAVYQQLTELHRYLLAIQNAPVPGKSALKAVQLRLDQNSSDPIFATRQMAKTLPAPLNRWVGRLADQAWHVVMVEAVHYMEVDWRDSVVKPFNEQLANNYPFNPRSAQDASLDAFERFFKPDGILDTFYQQNLKLFIDNDLSLEDGDNNVIIREDIIAQLETAQKIRDIFFSKQNGLGTSFAVETVSLSGNKRRSVLNLDGQLVDYSQGRNYTAHLVWPNNMREGNESKLTLIGTSGNAPRSISFSGPWAQFRLFGAGQLTGVQDGNFTVRFSVDGGAMTYRVHTDTEDNPFSGGLFSQFGLSDTLY